MADFVPCDRLLQKAYYGQIVKNRHVGHIRVSSPKITRRLADSIDFLYAKYREKRK